MYSTFLWSNYQKSYNITTFPFLRCCFFKFHCRNILLEALPICTTESTANLRNIDIWMVKMHALGCFNHICYALVRWDPYNYFFFFQERCWNIPKTNATDGLIRTNNPPKWFIFNLDKQLDTINSLVVPSIVVHQPPGRTYRPVVIIS